MSFKRGERLWSEGLMPNHSSNQRSFSKKGIEQKGSDFFTPSSSRRIMIMRFRPANISLINRRHYLPRLLLILSSIEKNDQRTLTGHYISISGLATTLSEPARKHQFIRLSTHRRHK